MSRGRGGRGGGAGGGGSGGPSGGARGGRGRGRGGGKAPWQGVGRTLDEGTEPSARGNGRGRGRGGPIRGVGFRVAAQNAVGYDYGTPLQSGQQSPAEQVSTADEGDDDIVLETHRKYIHVVKPHLEQQEAPQRYSPQNDAGPSVMLPPSVSNLYARSPSNLVAMERAQRAMEGQVAGLIPTGPKSAHVHRMYGTLDAVYNRNRNRQQQPQQQYPLPVSTPAGDKKKGGKFQRPADNSADDPCMAGIPRPSPRRDMPSKFNFIGKSAGGNLQLPVRFEKASGEWRDGAWVRAADGRELATKESVQEAAQLAGHSSDPFDRASGAGLGFHSTNAQRTAPAPLEDDLWAMEREQHDEQNDPIAALLKLHPGSTEMQEEGVEYDESFGYYQGSMGVMQVETGTRKQEDDVLKDESAGDEERLMDEADLGQMDENPSGDEDVILVPQAHSTEGISQMVESDSEEERQLDAIIKENSQGADGPPVVEQKTEEGFFVDLTGETEEKQSEAVQYDYASTAVIGEQISAEAADDEMMAEESSEEERVSLRQKQPRKGGKKARNAAKKARRRAKKGINVDSEPLVAREGDSDLEWGSDGPPVQFRKKADQESFIQGGPMQQLSLNVLSAPQSKEEEGKMLAIALANSVGTSKKTLASVQSHKEAIMADYMENAMGNNDDDDNSEGDVVTEQRDEKKVNQKTDLDALLQFINGMDGQRKGKEMTLEDIAIEKQMEEEEEWMTESGDEEDEDDKKFDAAVEKEGRRALPDESIEEDDSDDSDSSEEERPKKDRKETWSSSDDSDEDDDDDFDRHFSWADADEDFIKRLDKFAQANGSILKGRDRKARNRLFKMIETGTFDNLDEEDMIIDNDDPVFGLGALQPVKGGKKTKKTWGADHVFAEQLESQWQKDRAQKADNKRKRAAERAAAAENPYHGTQIKKGTKKMAKKAARAERRANKLKGGRSIEDDDDFDDDSGGGNSRHATNLFELDKQIQLFLRDTTKTTLSLSPMDKRARAQVHLLANCYNLTSKSIGTGTKRFPTLIKNQRSGLNVNFAKVNSVLNGSRGGFGSGYRNKDSNGVKVKDRASGVGAHVPKNQEGAAVGFGADRIGQDNIGHRLLTMMGWSEGLGVGRTQGLAEPVGATIKVTKSGLGF
jgi:hypothetical protein